MAKTNYLICPGGACPLRLTCQLFQNWLNNEDRESEELYPCYHKGKCLLYKQKEYYGG